jgi:hypothetical protein
VVDGQDVNQVEYLGQMREMLVHLETLGLVYRVR